MKHRIIIKDQPSATLNRLKTVFAFNIFNILSILMVLSPVQGICDEKTWEVSLGGGGYISNVYYGSDEMYAAPFPDVKVSYTNRYFSASVSFLDGIGVTYTNPTNHFFGSFNVNSGEERDSEKYSGPGGSMDHSEKVKKFLEGSPTVTARVKTAMMLGYLHDSGVFGISLEYHPTTRKGGGEEEQFRQGVLSSVSFMKPVSVTKKLSITGLLAVGMMDKNYADAWYSVKKATPSLKTFEAGPGLRDLQLVIQIDYQFSKHIGATFLARNSFLLMDAADSPYTTSRYQLTSGIYGVYFF